jgi:hypothetical protein
MFGLHPKFCFTNKKILTSCKWAIQIIFILYRGQDEKYFNCPFPAHMSGKKKTKFVFEGEMEGSTYKLTTTMHTNGDKCKREKKSFYWHTNPNCMSSFLLHPLTSGCL